jgi:hypothetical protein
MILPGGRNLYLGHRLALGLVLRPPADQVVTGVGVVHLPVKYLAEADDDVMGALGDRALKCVER